MAKIFIPFSRLDREQDYRIARELSIRLAERGHEIIQDDIELSKDIEFYFRRIINKVDVIIPLITEYSIDSKFFYDELLQLRNYTSHSEDKLMIPVFSSRVDFKMLPDSLMNIKGLRLENSSDEAIENIARRIDESINLFLGKKIASDERAQVIKDKIKHTAPEYITETIKDLTKRESYLKIIAFFWYFIGFVSIVGGVAAAVWFSNKGIEAYAGKENWSITVFYAIKSFFIIILLIAASKYSFNLGKSYMGESLKISDRIHAISFGKFYLQVFEQQTDPNELKEIFRDWNINNQNNTFISQSNTDFDPKLIEKIVEIIEKMKFKDSK